MRQGFDNAKYIELQAAHIKERISQFGGKLYLEFGGKLFDDYHASRVLPGFEPDSKFRMLKSIADDVEVIIAINANHIEKNKARGDLGITYDEDVLRLVDLFRGNGFVYLRPLYDGLFDMLGAETYERLVEKQIIEVAPLAYMRGRTLDDSFIILDEAQNTTPEQMKMFLTRMGVGSKVVVTGDVTQIDLPERTRSGLVDALHVLKNVNGIAQCYFTEKDVVRHRLVQEIIKAYEKAAHPEK